MAYKKHTLLVDANAIGYAWQQATKLTAGGMETQAVFGMLKTMKELRQTYPAFTLMILWDGRAQWRFNLHPGYKGNRNSDQAKLAMKESYAKQKPYLQSALSNLGIRQITAKWHEADDMAGIFVEKLSADPEHRVGVITGDQDWLQFIRPNVFWRDMRDDSRFVTSKNFYDYTGCKSPLQFVERKCLMGDSSDTIGGVGGIGEVGAVEFIAQFGSVREFWRQCDSGEFVPKALAHKRLWKGDSPHDKDRWADLYAGDKTDSAALNAYIKSWPGQGRYLFRRNFQLMQLLKVAPPNKEDVSMDRGRFDKEAFRSICEELSFMSILKNLDDFTNLFESKS